MSVLDAIDSSDRQSDNSRVIKYSNYNTMRVTEGTERNLGYFCEIEILDQYDETALRIVVLDEDDATETFEHINEVLDSGTQVWKDGDHVDELQDWLDETGIDYR